MARTVLVFESDDEFAAESRGELQKLGWEVLVFDDGKALFEQAIALRPELVLISVEHRWSRGQEALALCNRLKKTPALKSIPVIVLSNDSSHEICAAHRALDSVRADDYVRTPIAWRDLYARVQQFVGLGIAGPYRDSGRPY